MGEPDYNITSNPVFVVMMRNSRGKMFVYVAVLGIMCFIVFMLSSAHTSLKELEGSNEKCQQQRDSLSAQLQVVYEHKNRLEKSLQQEKTDHKHTKEANEKQASDLENKFQKEKDEREKLISQVVQLKNNYLELEEEKAQAETTLKEQLKSIQSQKDKEIDKLQAHVSDLLAEKEKLETKNNEVEWKLKQYDSEANLCSLQLVQIKTELQTCQEKVNVAENDALNAAKQGHVPEKPPQSPDKQVLPVENQVQPQENQVLPIANVVLPRVNKKSESRDTPLNKTASQATPIRASVLEKPHIMPANNLGEGVLPKPMDPKLEDAPKDLDAAVEVVDYKRNERAGDEPLLNNNMEENLDMKANLLNDENRLNNPNDNHPQVAPPHLEKGEDKDDHAAERGEDGNQYINPDAKQQVEVPVIGKPLPKDSLVAPLAENNDIAAQKNDMMNKSPGEVHNIPDQNVLGVPPAADHKNREFMHRGGDGHHVIDDKNYEEDDDERDNDDEPPNGLAPVAKGVNHLLQDNDFDDQENQDNLDNAKEEEGVVVAPK